MMMMVVMMVAVVMMKMIMMMILTRAFQKKNRHCRYPPRRPAETVSCFLSLEGESAGH